MALTDPPPLRNEIITTIFHTGSRELLRKLTLDKK